MDQYDPETFTAVLGVEIEDGSGYAANLRSFTKLMVQAKTKGLPPPYTDYKTIFLFELVPQIINKVMDTLQATGDDLLACVDFIKEAIGIILWSVTAVKSFKILNYIDKIFDPTRNFYTYSERSTMSNYAAPLVTFVQHFKSKFGPMLLMSHLLKPETQPEIVELIMRIMTKAADVIGAQIIFDKMDKYSSNLVTAIERFTEGVSDRELPYKHIFNIFDKCLYYIRTEDFISCAKAIISRFIDVEIAEIRLTGIKLCAKLYSNALTISEQEKPDSIDLLVNVIGKLQSLEALQIMKPVLKKQAERNAMEEEVYIAFYQTVIEQHPSILPSAIDIFADVILSNKEDSGLIFSIADDIPNMLLGRLLEGPQFAETVSMMLWSNVTTDPTIIETLTQAAEKADLGSILPNIDEVAGQEGMANKCAKFVEAVLKKSRAEFDPSNLIDCCIKEGVNEEGIKCLASIVSRLRKTFTGSQVAQISEALDNRTLCIFFKLLIPEGSTCLVGEDSLEVLEKIVNESGLERFDILDHAYHNVPYSNADPHIINEVVSAADKAFWNLAMEDNEQAREMLIEVREERSLPEKLIELVRRSMEALKETPKGALIFALTCINKAAEYVSPETIGYAKHMYEDPENEVEITVKKGTDTFTIRVSSRESSSVLKPMISNVLDIPVPSIVIYYNKSCLKPCRIKDLTSKEIEVRILNEYEAPAVFTAEKHPITEILPHYKELLDILTTENAVYAYNVLIQLPTPDDFAIEKLVPEEQYTFLYQLHYIAKHKEECAELVGDIDKLFVDSFEVLLPESRYIISSLLTKESKLLIPALKYLTALPNNTVFERIAKRIIKHIENCEVELDSETIKAFLFDERKSFVEIMLKTNLIKHQEFGKVWQIFEEIEDKIPHVFVITELNPPVEFAERITEMLTPLFETLNSDVIECLSMLCKTWEEFPIERFSETLIDGFIRCTRKEVAVTEAPFSLLSTMISRDKEFEAKVIEELNANIPENIAWGYIPEDKERSRETDRCGLRNLGATCYVNSIIQQLFNIEAFRNFIINTQFDDEGLNALHKLFTKMMYSQEKSIDMQEFANSWKDWDGEPIRAHEQQDANEFLMYILTKLEGTPGEAIFRGILTNNLSGEGFTSTQREPFTILPLEVNRQKDLNDSLKLFEVPETINDYRADGIDHLINVQHFTSIETLPDFLIIQLKRFDFSIESGMRTKIDSKYIFPETAEIYGSKFNLAGVVVHQGDAEAGHYFSYTKGKEWICMNDVQTTFVKDSVFMGTCTGELEFGTSAYLLFYTKDGAEPEVQPLNPEKELIDEINEENHKLLLSRVYFSPEFNTFVESISSIESCRKFVFSYYTKVLSHANTPQIFEKMSSRIIELMDNGALEEFQEYITDNIQDIADIMISSTPVQNRDNFAKVIKHLFEKIPEDNDIILIFISQIIEWAPLILAQWRTSFDIFKIISDFASIDEEHLEFLNGIECSDILISFVVDEIPKFVNNKENTVPKDRFCKITNCSYIINTLNALGAVQECLSPKFMKWCVGSEKNAESLINLFVSNKVMAINKVITDCYTQVSEELILELILKADFSVPDHWLQTGFLAEKEAQCRLARALSKIQDPTEIIAKQPELITTLMFSQNEEVRQDTLESIKTHPSDNQFDVLAPLVREIPRLSKCAYLQNGKQSAIPFSMFPGYEFLKYLLLLLPQHKDAFKFASVFRRAIIETVKVGGLYDYHLLLLIQLYCNAARNGEITPTSVGEEEVVAIHKAIDDFPANISGREETVRSYLLFLAIAVEKTKLSADDLLGDKISALNEVIFSTKYPTAAKAAMTLTEAAAKRYATATKLFKSVVLYMHTTSETTPFVYEFFSYFKDDVIKSYSTYLLSHSETVKSLIKGVKDLNGHEKFFPRAIAFVDYIARNGTHQLDTVIREDPIVIKPYFVLANDPTIEQEALSCVFSIISNTFEYCKPVLEEIYGETVIARTVPASVANPYVASLLLLLLKLWVDDIPSDFIQRKIGLELGTLFLNCTNMEDIQYTLTILTDVMNYVEDAKMQVIFETIDNLHCLHNVWDLEPYADPELAGLVELTLYVCCGSDSREETELILKSAEKYKEKSKFYRKLIDELLNGTD